MDALYFPYLSLPASTWVNPALLYFDRLGVLAPEGPQDGLFDRRTDELVDLGLARAITPHGLWDDEENSLFLAYMIGRASAERTYGRIERIHVGKLAYTPLSATLENAGLLTRVDGAWLEGASWVVGRVMAYLAVQTTLHSRRPLSLLTDERTAARAVVGQQEAQTVSRRLRAVSRLLPVPADAAPTDIDRFRRRHRNELFSFRDHLDELITRGVLGEGEAEFEQRLNEAVRLRDHLVAEMSGFKWRRLGPQISIAALTAGGSALDDSPWSAGAGLLGVVLAGIQATTAFRERRRAMGSPMVYAALVAGRWQPQA